jgi:hypothetical protein
MRARADLNPMDDFIRPEQTAVAENVQVEGLLVCVELGSKIVLKLLDEVLAIHPISAGPMKTNEPQDQPHAGRRKHVMAPRISI